MTYKNHQRYYDNLKSTLEEQLGLKLQQGTVKVSSEEYNKLCEEIEEAAEMGSRYATAYDEND